MKIRKRTIGDGSVYIIAEMSANHGHSFERAVEIVRMAKACGADAVKVQTYTPDTMTLKSGLAPFKIAGGTPWDGRTLHDLYGEAQMPWEWQPKLKEIADNIGVDLFSSPFDATSVDFLERMDVPAYKVASFEIVDIALIERIARTRKPIIISTGMASMEEIQDAVMAARGVGATELALLKCTSAYPAAPEEMNLRTICDMQEKFKLPVGLSDHTLETVVPVAAVALGAVIIEKHFTLSRSIPGPDSAFSLEPHEFTDLVRAIRIVEKAMGQVKYGASASEKKSQVFRRSLFIVESVAAGEVLTEKNVRAIRPGMGLSPKHLKVVLGQRATRALQKGTALQWEHIEEVKRKIG